MLWYAIVGFCAGALAKMIMPGDKKEPRGCLLTILLGVGGAMLTGFVLETLLGRNTQGGLIPSIFGATLGAMALIFLMRKFLK